LANTAPAALDGVGVVEAVEAIVEDVEVTEVGDPEVVDVLLVPFEEGRELLRVALENLHKNRSGARE
jgi:hypothetical protein